MHFSTLLLSLVASASLLPIVASHGYLYYPPPRGIQKEAYQIDDLKSPNRKGVCRGEPVGQITPVTPGGSVTLKFHITAPHVGPCSVYLLDENLGNPKKIADKMDCAAPGKGGPWTIQLPSGVSGHKVLRWTWEGRHVSPGEPYEQCIDVSFGGSGGGDKYTPPPPQKNDEVKGADTEKGPQEVEERPSKQPNNQFGANRRPSKTYEQGQDQESPKAEDQPQQAMGNPYESDQQQNDDDSNDTKGNNPSPPPTTPQYGGEGEGGSCTTNGQYQCQGEKFAQCSNGQWYVQACASGTACQPTDEGGILCARSDAQLV